MQAKQLYGRPVAVVYHNATESRVYIALCARGKCQPLNANHSNSASIGGVDKYKHTCHGPTIVMCECM